MKPPSWDAGQSARRTFEGVSSNAARLGRDRGRVRLHRVPVSRCQPWRPPLADPARARKRADLSAVAGDLLHVLDVFRLGRIRHPHQRGFSRDLCRPDPDDCVLHAAAPPRDQAREIAEHHLDRRFHRGTLRQEPGRRRNRRADRDHRLGSLHRAPAQGRGVVAGNDPQRRPGLLRHADRRRYGAGGHAGDGGIRGPVRDPPDRRDGASARPDAGGRHRIHRQAGGLSRGRRIRHILDVLTGRVDRTRDEDARSGAGHQLHAIDRQFPDHDAAVVLRDHAAAAPVSRQRGREFDRCRGRPGALAGLVSFPFGAVDSDMYVLALPMEGNSPWLSVGVFVGGLSAATAMVIVECVALSIMVSNDIVVPLVLQRGAPSRAGQKDFGNFLLRVRRFAIFAIMVMAYFYYRALGNTQLAAIGLLSFAAIAQLAPAFFGGLFWRRATARGAMAGILVGIAAWSYTLFLPSFLGGNTAGLFLLQHGPFGIEALRPQALFGADLPPLLHGVLWSLSLNLLTYVVLSLSREPSSIERLQADLFVPNALAPIAPTFRRWRTTVTVQDIQSTVAQYLGPDRARHSFEAFAAG